MIKVMTYNIHGAVGTDKIRDYDRIGSLLKKEKIDIVLIQEVDSPPSERSLSEMINKLKTDHFSFSMTASTIDTPERYLGNAILSRFPFEHESVLQIGVPHRECRNIMEAIVSTPKGRLRVLNTHFGLSRRERCKQFAKMYELLQKNNDLPFIIGGDINEWTPVVRRLTQMNKTFTPLKTERTFPTRFPIFRLDRMWCQPSTLVKKNGVFKTPFTKYYSDHYPILAEIEL